MGWSGNFQIKYNGTCPKNFHKLAKMVIPNSLLKFNFDSCKMDDNSVELLPTRIFRWYTADEDMKKLMEFFPDGDSITMKISGEGEYEEVEIAKVDGEVTYKSSNKESNRYKSRNLGISVMLYEAMSKRFVKETETIDICSLEGYIQLIANTFADEVNLIPSVQRFMYTVLDKNKINLAAYDKEDELNDEDCAKLMAMRDKFRTILSTSIFLDERKNSNIEFKSGVAQDINTLPDWLKKYPPFIIDSLGGAALLKELIETKGEEEAKNIVEMLGNGIMEELGMDDSYGDEYLFGSKRK